MDAQTLTQVVDDYRNQNDVRVQYQDVANPLRVGTVVEHVAGEFRIVWDDEDGGETWSDLRQAGWALATPGSLRMLERRTEFVVQVYSRGRWAKVRGNEGGPWRTRQRAERIAELRQAAEPVGLSSTEGKPHRVVEVPA